MIKKNWQVTAVYTQDGPVSRSSPREDRYRVDRLLKQTYLPSRSIDQLYDEGLVYADAKGDAVFIERDIKGDAAGAIKQDANGQFVRIENSDDAAAF